MMLLAGLVGFQLLAFGYAAVMADHAAEVAALALANGREPEEAVDTAVPGWPRSALRVHRGGSGQVSVTLIPPSPLRFLRGRLAVTGEAAVREPAAGAATGVRISSFPGRRSEKDH
jgi:hypothetical protein